MSAHQETVENLLATLIWEQQQTREAITSLAEALAGVRADVERGASTVKPDTAKDAEPPGAKETPSPAAPEEQEQEQEQEVDINRLREAFAAKSRGGKKAELKELLASYGAKKLPDLKESQYAEVLQKANAL